MGGEGGRGFFWGGKGRGGVGSGEIGVVCFGQCQCREVNQSLLQFILCLQNTIISRSEMSDEKIMRCYAHTPDPFPPFFPCQAHHQEPGCCGRPSCIELLQDGRDSTSTKVVVPEATRRVTDQTDAMWPRDCIQCEIRREARKVDVQKCIINANARVDCANHDWS